MSRFPATTFIYNMTCCGHQALAACMLPSPSPSPFPYPFPSLVLLLPDLYPSLCMDFCKQTGFPALSCLSPFFSTNPCHLTFQLCGDFLPSFDLSLPFSFSTFLLNMLSPYCLFNIIAFSPNEFSTSWLFSLLPFDC